MVAVDSVENLTARAGTSSAVYVQIDAGGADPQPVLQAVSGVTMVAASNTADRPGGFDVQSDTGHDVRRELAAAIVTRGWGLLELRPVRKSLEDVFLNLTTEETSRRRRRARNGDCA